MDDIGLVDTVDRFGEGIVVTGADTPDRRLETNADTLEAAIPGKAGLSETAQVVMAISC